MVSSCCIHFVPLMIISALFLFHDVQCRSLSTNNFTESPIIDSSTISKQIFSPKVSEDGQANELRPVFSPTENVLSTASRDISDRSDQNKNSINRDSTDFNKTISREDSASNSTTSTIHFPINSRASSSMISTSLSSITSQSASPSSSFINILRDYEKRKLKSATSNQRQTVVTAPTVNYEDGSRSPSSTSSREPQVIEPNSLQGYSKNLIPSPDSLYFNQLEDDSLTSAWAEEEPTFGMPDLKNFAGHLDPEVSSYLGFHPLAHHAIDFIPNLDYDLLAHDTDHKNPTASQSTQYESSYQHPMSGDEDEVRSRHPTNDESGGSDQPRHVHNTRPNHGRSKRPEHANNQEHHNERGPREHDLRSTPSVGVMTEGQSGSHGENGNSNSDEGPGSSSGEIFSHQLGGHDDLDDAGFLNYAQMMSNHMGDEPLPILIESYVVNYPPLTKQPQPIAHSLSAYSYEQQFPAINSGYQHPSERVLVSPFLYSRECKYDCFASPLQDMKYGLMNFLQGAHNHG